VVEIGTAEPLSAKHAQIFRKPFQQPFAVFCGGFSILFVFDNVPPNFPVRLQQTGVYRLCRPFLSGKVAFRNPADKVLVVSRSVYCCHYSLFLGLNMPVGTIPALITF